MKNKAPFKDGITFTSKKILQAAVVFLGFGLNLSVIAQMGKESLPIICCTIATSLILALIRTQKEKKQGIEGGTKVSLKKIFPFFILHFVLASIVTTVITNAFADTSTVYIVATQCFSFLKWLSKFFIIMAMAAIGLNTDIVKLVKSGGKPILLGFCCWAGITGMSLPMQHFLHLW